MDDFKIHIADDHACVYTPYNGDFVTQIKCVGGAKWDRECKCWTVPSGSIDAVREIMRSVYGRDDQPAAETVTLRLKFEKEISEWHGDVIMFGKSLSHAYGRDSGGRCGEGVCYVSKSPKSGGSVKNWTSVVPEGAEIILTDVPKTLWDSYEPKEGITVALEDEQKNLEALRQEREKLLARITEINALLEGEASE